MDRYRGYSESIEVLIDILDEQKKQTALLEKIVEQKEVPHVKTVQNPKRTNKNSPASRRNVLKSSVSDGAVQSRKRAN